MPFASYPSLSEIPEQVWIFLGKSIGAICGSAISIAYLLPANRREAFLRFLIGTTVGMMFGTFVGMKMAEQLGIIDRISKVEIALSGAAMASLCAWWGLGVMARVAGRVGTIWGALIAVSASLVSALGISVDTAAQNDLAEAMIQLIAAIGAMMAIYGRLSATEIIA